MLNIECRHLIRQYELSLIIPIIGNKDGDILEVGSGTGFQAKLLSEAGYKIAAIDIEDSNYADDRVFPVMNYDGRHIPYPDNSFDIVYTSSVLEHIPDIYFFQDEIRRVLRPNGLAIHSVPSAVWRFWSNFTHYKRLFWEIIDKFKKTKAPSQPKSKQESTTSNNDISPQKATFIQKIKNRLIPNVHGEKGNAYSELYYFSRYGWNSLFKKTEWRILERRPAKIFYTGSKLFGLKLSISSRQILSKFLGSSSHIYIVQPD